MVYSLEEIARRVRPIAERHHLRAVYVFGSYARGEATEDSDIDFLLDISGTEIKSLLQLAAVYCDLEDAFEKRVDVVTVDSLEQELQRPSQRHFRQAVLNERVSLYVAA